VRRWLRETLGTPSAVYGLVLYQALIAAKVGDEDDQTPTALVAVISVATLLVFFAAHVFAEWVAGHGRHDLRHALRRAFANSLGMLLSAIPPTIVLIVCAVLGIAAWDAEDWAMLVAVLMLAFLGYEAFAQRGYPVWLRVVGGALGTATIGVIVILLNFLAH